MISGQIKNPNVVKLWYFYHFLWMKYVSFEIKFWGRGSNLFLQMITSRTDCVLDVFFSPVTKYSLISFSIHDSGMHSCFATTNLPNIFPHKTTIWAFRVGEVRMFCPYSKLNSLQKSSWLLIYQQQYFWTLNLVWILADGITKIYDTR